MKGVTVGRGTIRTRVCNRCGAEKPLSAFRKDRSRDNGYGYICLVCHREQAKEYRRKKKLPAGAEHATVQPMMSDQLFNDCYRDRTLRELVRKAAAWHAEGDPHMTEDYMQVGWMWIAHCRPGLTTEHYLDVATRAMGRERWKQRNVRMYQLDTIEAMCSQEYSMWNRGFI